MVQNLQFDAIKKGSVDVEEKNRKVAYCLHTSPWVKHEVQAYNSKTKLKINTFCPIEEETFDPLLNPL